MNQKRCHDDGEQIPGKVAGADKSEPLITEAESVLHYGKKDTVGKPGQSKGVKYDQKAESNNNPAIMERIIFSRISFHRKLGVGSTRLLVFRVLFQVVSSKEIPFKLFSVILLHSGSPVTMSG